jgi:hypothetical protein
MQPRNLFEMGIQTVDAAVSFNGQGDDDKIRQRQGHAFTKQMRRKVSGLEPGGLSHFIVRQSQQGVFFLNLSLGGVAKVAFDCAR